MTDTTAAHLQEPAALLLSKPLPPTPMMEDVITEEQSETEDKETQDTIEFESESAQQPKTGNDEPADSLPELLSSTSISRPALPPRSYTAPGSPSSLAPVSKLASLSIQPRNRSPYSRSSHLRSRSSTASPLLLQPSVRSKSLSFVETPPHGVVPRPSSPLARPSSPFSAARRPSPLRRPLLEESHSFSGVEIDQTISEHKELDLRPRPPSLSVEAQHDYLSAPNTPGNPFTPTSPFGGSSTTPVSPFSASSNSGHGTFPRMNRRRPSSPLHVSLSSPNYRRLHTSTSSPALRSPTSPAAIDHSRYNESFPQAMGSVGSGGMGVESGPGSVSGSAHLPPPLVSSTSVASGSSMPSTPSSSFRSRSPSISSLETIPDSPDAEEEAVAAAESDREKDAIARLKAAVERSEAKERDGRLRGRSLGRAGEFSLGVGQDKRKRWSVCGAERRGDLEMETIWED